MKLLEITYSIPITWLVGTVVTVVFGIARIYAMSKSVVTRVDNLEALFTKFEDSTREMNTEMTRQNKKVAEDVAFIKGVIKQLNAR